LLASRWPLFALGIVFYVVSVFMICRKRSLEQAAVLGLALVPVVFYAANYYLHTVCLLPLIAAERRGPEQATQGRLSAADSWVWVILLGLCTAQYWTVLVSDLPLHFHLSTVLLFGALTLMMAVLLREAVRSGRLDRVSRLLSRARVVSATGPPTGGECQ
jgi:hypothetical protein